MVIEASLKIEFDVVGLYITYIHITALPRFYRTAYVASLLMESTSKEA